MKQSQEENNNSRKGYTFTQLTFITRKENRKKAGRRQAGRQTDRYFVPRALSFHTWTCSGFQGLQHR